MAVLLNKSLTVSTSNNIPNTSGSEFFNAIAGYVKDLKLNSAIKRLEAEVALQGLSSEKAELARIRETYSLMSRFLTTGAPDPSRADMTSALRRDILAMADRLDFARLVADSGGSYYSTARVLSHRKQRLAELIADYDKAWLLYSTATADGSFEPDLAVRYEETLQELFRAVMATPPGQLSDEDVSMIVERAADAASDFALSSQLVSALLIGLLEHYDRNRFLALISIYEQSEEERVQAQALVGLTLAIRYHADRLKYDKELDRRLLLLTDDFTLYPRLRDIFYSLLQAQDTKRIISYFQSDILPQIQKMNPDELKKMMEKSLSMDELENPEWAEKLEKSELGKKLRKLNDMQFKGGDAFVMAFANLKMFPFFGSPGNWLLPFSANHSVVQSTMSEEMKPLMEFLESADMMCDSDKYSFVLAMRSQPFAHRSAMIGSLTANLETLREQLATISESETRFKREVVRYIRNLYRLFTLSSKLFATKRDTPADPVALLESNFEIMNLPYLGELLGQQDVLEIAAEFNFKRKNFDIAAPLLEELLKFEDTDTGKIWEQLGYIYETKDDPKKALDFYRKAELMKPDNVWLLTHLARALEATGKFAEAEETYSRLDSEENPNLLASHALLLLRLGKYDQAAQIFSKLNYEVSEGQITAFDKSLQPAPASPITASDLVAFWSMLTEMARGDYDKAETLLPMNLPEAYSAYYILFSFLQGNYALTLDGLKELEEREKRVEAARLVSRFDPTLTSTSARVRLHDFFIKHIEAAGASVDDFLLLSDAANA